jgi:hypothetical protein
MSLQAAELNCLQRCKHPINMDKTMNTASRLLTVALTATVAASVTHASDLRVGIEKNSKTNLSAIHTSYESLADYLRASSGSSTLRHSVDNVQQVLASMGSQQPPFLLVHSHAGRAAQDLGGYVKVADLAQADKDKLHLLTSSAAPIENIKSLSGKRLIVGKPEAIAQQRPLSCCARAVLIPHQFK